MGKSVQTPQNQSLSLVNDRPWVPHPISRREREKAAAANRPVSPPATTAEEPREPPADVRFNQPD